MFYTIKILQGMRSANQSLVLLLLVAKRGGSNWLDYSLSSYKIFYSQMFYKQPPLTTGT